MYRFRLIDEANGSDLGPLVSSRLVFQPGEMIGRQSDEQLELINVVAPENENFRAYLIVRRA